MRQLFGTDGIRGKVNTYPITPELALQVGKAIAQVHGAKGHGSTRAVLGKDTRLSGYMLETALLSGLVSMGMDVFQIGPMPTPGIAHLTRSMGADCGIMITASHNPSDDNGIKIFSSEGYKLPDALEERIESLVLGGDITSAHIDNGNLGKAYRIEDARGRYIEFAKSSIRNRNLKGVKIVLDCANGAGYWIAPLIFRELGADVTEIGVEPDGHNINDGCGATHPEAVVEAVRKTGADVGISLDGDGDRVIFCDAAGQVVNGDRILGMCAINLQEQELLKGGGIVVTSMSNLGLIRAMEARGIGVEITSVGDRFVLERMLQNGCNLGGEQSGHVIFLDYVTTGDGIITALHVLKMMSRRQKSLSELADFMHEYPQKLDSFPVVQKVPIEETNVLRTVISECEAALGAEGRVVVRYSGTEAKIRILVEANRSEDVERWSAMIRSAAEKELCG
jgi:phosphoglucosamine mutase